MMSDIKVGKIQEGHTHRGNAVLERLHSQMSGGLNRFAVIAWTPTRGENVHSESGDAQTSDIWVFRLYGQFLLGPQRNQLSYNKSFRLYGLNFVC